MNQRIRFGESVEPFLPEERLPAQSSSCLSTLEVSQSAEQFQVYLTENMLREVTQHLRENQRVESGGVLIGHPFRDVDAPSRVFVIIAGAVRQDSDNHSVGHFTVGPREIALAREVTEQRYPGLVVVGWYHSHPGHGVYLSSQDRQIVRSLYNIQWHVALVMDPQHQEMAFFRGPEGERLPGWHVLRETTERRPASIVAIALYNQRCQARESGQHEAARKLLQQLHWAISENVDLQHWLQRGRYQEIPLVSEHEAGSFGLGAKLAEVDEQAAKQILETAQRCVAEGNLDAAVRNLHVLQQRYSEYHCAAVIQLLQQVKQIQARQPVRKGLSLD